jgi:hypothetical protein
MRRAWHLIETWIDSESVRPFQYLVHACTLGGGVQCIVMNPPSAVSSVMGDHFDTVWTLLLIACPLLACLGAWWRRRNIAGLWVQLAGDVGFTLALWAYVAALVQATYAQSATFAAWIAASLAISGLGVTVRDLRLIRAVTTQMHRLEQEAR